MSSVHQTISWGATGTLCGYAKPGPRAIARAAMLILASELPDYMIGTTAFVDGGMAVYPSFRGAE